MASCASTRCARAIAPISSGPESAAFSAGSTSNAISSPLTAGEAEISANRAALTLSLDGETLTLPTPLRYRILPGALTLMVPQEQAPER